MKFISSFYLSKSTFITLGLCIVFFSFGLLLPVFFTFGKLVFYLLWVAIFIETVFLYKTKNPIEAKRLLPIKLSNGDINTVALEIINKTNAAFTCTILEDLPEQFQIRKWEKSCVLSADYKTIFKYEVSPKTRGLYVWKDCNFLLYLWKYGFVFRKAKINAHQEVACYPSFDQFNRIPMKALISQFSESNEKLIRKIGQSLEFEQIKDYATGDDYRHINWKASAKKGQMMVNQYQDERSQDIYCMIDKGRTMLMPFEEQTLLDYAINGALALSKSIIDMQDKAGLVGFSAKKCDFLKAQKDLKQFGKINEMLYNLETQFLESDFEMLYKFVRINIKHRSLLVIFTNFDSVNSMNRQLPYLRSLSKYHLLLVVFFENTEIAKMSKQQAKNIKEIYANTIANSLHIKNKLIVKELNKYGIQGLSVEPHNLSIEVINKYLQIKKTNLI